VREKYLKEVNGIYEERQQLNAEAIRALLPSDSVPRA
jgi:hypothetical protein